MGEASAGEIQTNLRDVISEMPIERQPGMTNENSEAIRKALLNVVDVISSVIPLGKESQAPKGKSGGINPIGSMLPGIGAGVMVGAFVNPFLGILVGIAPTLINLFFGSKKQQAEPLAEVRARVGAQVIPALMSRLENQIIPAVMQTRDSMFEEIKNKIDENMSAAQDALEQAKKEKENLQTEYEDNIARIKADVETLKNMVIRACIGIVVANPNLESRLKCLGNFSINVWKLPIVAPYLLLGDNGSPHIQALSRAGKIVNLAEIDGHPENAQKTLTGEELQTLLELAQDGINPRDVISALLYFTPLTRLKSSYLVFTPDEFGRQGSGKLLAQCDAMIVLGNNADSAWFKLLRDNFTMPVYLLADNAAWADYARNYLQSRYAGRTVEIMSPDLLGSILVKLDGHV